MSDINTTDVQSRTLTAFFDTPEAADRAVSDLEAAGVPRQHIRRVGGASSSSAAETRGDTGFWESLKDIFLPDEDRYGYAEGLRRGGHMIAVTVDEANLTRVMGILDREGAVDMDEREASWRKEGWTGYQAGDAGVGTTTASSGKSARGGATAATPLRSDVGQSATSTGAAARGTLESGGEEIIPVYEEQLRVGKRDVSHGRVRLRSYVVETPVNEQVRLREERVSVERRPVNRPATGVTGDVFGERVIEIEERAEEALVSKDVRVKEEIALRKEAAERTETVSDTVRRTEVDVQDGRGLKASATASAGAAASSWAGRIAAHMDVIASDGSRVGKVDQLEGSDRIKLTRTDSPDGQHHLIPLSWIDHVDQHVHLNRTAEAVRAGW